jgi:hypothetical protein
MDCTAIGDGVGVSCIVNASWPFFESSVGPNAEPPPAERINTFRPALLVLGFSTDPPLVRGILATANDSFSTTGKLDGSSVKSMNRSSCWDECVSFIEISVTADGNIATLTLRPPGAEARIVAHRDPNARAQEALKSMKAR